MATLLLQLLDESICASKQAKLIEGNKVSPMSSGKPSFKNVSWWWKPARCLQWLYGCWQCVCAGCLWASRASPLWFHWAKRGHSCSHQRRNPPHPKTTALLHKQGPCCVCERAPDTQPLMERIRLGCRTLIHCSRQHSIDASLSAHKGLPGTKTCCLKSLQDQTKAALRPWTNIYWPTHAVLGACFLKSI